MPTFMVRSLQSSIVLGAALLAASGAVCHAQPANYVDPLPPKTISEVNATYHRLIEAENRHDVAKVRTMVWDSPSTLFVAKTATAAEGNWAGFWGKDVVLQHFRELYSGIFVMYPDYANLKTVGLTSNIAETYVPLKISVAYAGQTPVPKPFLMIVDWIRTPAGWKLATDVALPVPPAPPGAN